VDITQGEKVEQELDHMISRADERRRLSQGERREVELWQESVRRYNARQEADHRAAWREYELRLYRIHSGLAAEHLARAEKLQANGHYGEEK
jgi:hypothetical protein